MKTNLAEILKNPDAVFRNKQSDTMITGEELNKLLYYVITYALNDSSGMQEWFNDIFELVKK